MRAAKEKTLIYLVILITIKMVYERLREAAALQTNNYDENRQRNSEKTPIGSQKKIRSIVPVVDSPKPRKRIGESCLQLRRSHRALGTMYFRARYYDPKTGEFISQDPYGFPNGNIYHDGYSLFRGYFAVNGRDPSGMVCKPDFCGPDATKAFTSFLARIAPNLRSLPSDEVGEIDGTIWLWNQGNNIDFYLGRPNFISKTFPGCATKKCRGTVQICGLCARATQLNNILFGVVAAAHGVPRGVANAGANVNEYFRRGRFEGPKQNRAYWVGYNVWNGLLRWAGRHHSSDAICEKIKRMGQCPDFKDCADCGSTAKFGDFGRVGIGGTPIPGLR